MTQISRRGFLLVSGAGALAACSNAVGSQGGAEIDARVDAALNYLQTTYPGTVDLANKSSGILVMPLVTKAGFGIGGSYGRGALRVGGATVDYYAAAQGSFGLQIGAQQYAHALFFMTPEALQEFRTSPGWEAGADLEYVYQTKGENASATTTTELSPVQAVIFGQAGLLIGASIEGTKYTRIIP
jgi:lipid-binding SYLF domain-containing protein